MDFYIGITDPGWYSFHKERKSAPINFWRPGGTAFKRIGRGAPFLLKLKGKSNAIAGIGFFSGYYKMPLSMAWKTFGTGNGCLTYSELIKKIFSLRVSEDLDPEIGCVVLSSPIYFDKEDWIPADSFWKPGIQQGAGFSSETSPGKEIWLRVEEILQKYLKGETEQVNQYVVDCPGDNKYRLILSKRRIDQPEFKLMMISSYQGKCAISGEKTLPALEAAHILPWSENGPSLISNGMLLRSDIHNLFDSFYMTIDKEYNVFVSKRIKEEFENGKEYYQFDGKPLKKIPDIISDRPGSEFISWHNSRFKG